MYYHISNLSKGSDHVKYVARSRSSNKKWSEASSLIWWSKPGNETWSDPLDEVIVMMINLSYTLVHLPSCTVPSVSERRDKDLENLSLVFRKTIVEDHCNIFLHNPLLRAVHFFCNVTTFISRTNRQISIIFFKFIQNNSYCHTQVHILTSPFL